MAPARSTCIHGQKAGAPFAFVGAADQDAGAAAPRLGGELLGGARLADAGLADQQDQTA